MIEPGKGLRFLCVGAGAIGTYIGGSLAISGEDVTYVERPGIAEELCSTGLQIQKNGKGLNFPNPKVFTSSEAAFSFNSYDVVIFAVKGFDTQAALKGIGPFEKKISYVLCLQNGVENENLISSLMGRERVIPGTVTTAVGKMGVGKIIVEKLRGIGISKGSPISENLLKSFNRAGLNAKLYTNADAMKWSKMVTNLVCNASSAILDMKPSEIINHPQLFRLEREQIREALSVMKALGIPVINIPGTAVKLFGTIINYFPDKISRVILDKAVGSGRGQKLPSFHIDLHSGRGVTEVDFLNGAVVRAGKQVGLDTPVNLLLNTTLQMLTSGQESQDKFNHHPEQLMELWNNSGIL